METPTILLSNKLLFNNVLQCMPNLINELFFSLSSIAFLPSTDYYMQVDIFTNLLQGENNYARQTTGTNC